MRIMKKRLLDMEGAMHTGLIKQKKEKLAFLLNIARSK
jgi:hypothetical protein